MGVHARVALGGVQVLVAEQFLDLTQVGTRAEKLRGETWRSVWSVTRLRSLTPAAVV